LDVRVAALSEQDGRQREAEQADRDVDEEDPLPAQRVGQDAAEQDAGDRADRADRAPEAEGGVALLALGEGRGQDGERRGRDQGRSEALQRAGADQRALAPGEPGEQRREGEQEQSGDEDATSADEVGDASAEEEEASEEERVRRNDPLQVLL